MTPEEAFKAVRRGTIDCHTEEDLKRKLGSGRKLRIKLGVDPTSPDLHLGHTVQLSRLRAFQDLGHTAVLIIGDYTARVGDPSGRDSTRPSLSADIIAKNAETYKTQAFKVLDQSKTELRYNSEWLESFVQKELFSVLQRYTVNQLMQREDFAKRQAENKPITLLEILYPIFQGYDSVAIKSDVEMGGSDQLFNLLMGRTMQKDFGQEPQVCLTLPLLVGTDGIKKMSKSYGNYIGITEAPREIFGKVMRISDELMWNYYELLTDKNVGDLKGGHAMDAKKALAELLTARFHGSEAGKSERDFFEKTFSKKEIPTDIPFKPNPGALNFWSQLLVKLDMVDSRKEAQRLIEQGAFSVDGKVIKDDKMTAAGAVRRVTLKVGKHKFCQTEVALP